MSAPPGERHLLVPAAYVLPLREGADGPEVLLQLRRGTGFMDEHWAAGAAGHVEHGETAYDAARREAAEEIGIGELELVFTTTLQRTGGGEPIGERVDFFFTSRSWRGTPRVREPERCAALRWFPLSALPEPVVPHERVVLEAIASGTAPPYLTLGFEGSTA